MHILSAARTAGENNMPPTILPFLTKKKKKNMTFHRICRIKICHHAVSKLVCHHEAIPYQTYPKPQNQIVHTDGKYKSGYWISNPVFYSAFIAVGKAFILSHNRELYKKGNYQAKQRTIQLSIMQVRFYIIRP